MGLLRLASRYVATLVTTKHGLGATYNPHRVSTFSCTLQKWMQGAATGRESQASQHDSGDLRLVRVLLRPGLALLLPITRGHYAEWCE
jgi:hypothetical protein